MFPVRPAILWGRLILSLALANGQPSGTASIQGIVKDDAGHAVPATQAIIRPTGPGDSSLSAITGILGEFTVRRIRPGKYSICVQSPSTPT
jgi:hypothetical protein